MSLYPFHPSDRSASQSLVPGTNIVTSLLVKEQHDGFAGSLCRISHG